ncbi:CCR4-NOT transcription complex subunit 1 [Cichlidogyrus casuarinus]|uniref:CCR4-NOT transcription complex subunit 1 n=1 Tax=Cichlidogyrus casuarinus TaxID=1844966 RepID=A0ABD2PPS4_9PLAT
MTQSPLKLVYKHINYLIKHLTKKNYKHFTNELIHYASCYGFDVEAFILKCVMSHMEFSAEDPVDSSPYFQFFANEYQRLIGAPNFLTLLCHCCALAKEDFAGNFVERFTHCLTLGPSQSIITGLAFMHSSNPTIVKNAIEFIGKQLLQSQDEYKSDYFAQLNTDQLQFILLNLFAKNQWTVHRKSINEKILSSLRKSFHASRVPLVLRPLLDTQNVPEISLAHFFPNSSLLHAADAKQHSFSSLTIEEWFPSSDSCRSVEPVESHFADFIAELGYNCTMKQVKETMHIALSEIDNKDITADAVAQAICLFMNTWNGSLYTDECGAYKSTKDSIGYSEETLQSTLHVAGSISFEDFRPGINQELNTWNIEVFFEAVFELNPLLHLELIVKALDRPEFHVASKTAFLILNQCLRLCSRNLVPLPISLFYDPWRNAFGQFSFLKACFHYQDILTYHELNEVDLSKFQLPATPLNSPINVHIWCVPKPAFYDAQ